MTHASRALAPQRWYIEVGKPSACRELPLPLVAGDISWGSTSPSRPSLTGAYPSSAAH